MKPKISGSEGRVPGEENRGGLEELVGLTQIPDLGLEPLDLLQLRGRRPGSVTAVDLSLQDPLTQGLDPRHLAAAPAPSRRHRASGTARAGPSPSAAPAHAARPGT